MPKVVRFLNNQTANPSAFTERTSHSFGNSTTPGISNTFFANKSPQAPDEDATKATTCGCESGTRQTIHFKFISATFFAHYICSLINPFLL